MTGWRLIYRHLHGYMVTQLGGYGIPWMPKGQASNRSLADMKKSIEGSVAKRIKKSAELVGAFFMLASA